MTDTTIKTSIYQHGSQHKTEHETSENNDTSLSKEIITGTH